MSFANRVEDIVASVAGAGLGDVTLAGTSPDLRQGLIKLGGVGVTFDYWLEQGENWEMGEGTITGANSFSRVPSDSSAGGAAVVFTAGATFGHDVSAQTIAKFQATKQIAFATTIPLTAPGTSFMPQQTVTGAIAFAASAGPVPGSLVYLRLVANGANAPTFPGFKEWGGSLGYDNRNGIVNIVQFFADGTDTWYSIAQQANAVAVDTTAPVLTNPTSASTGSTTGSGSVTTDEAGGTLYYLTTLNATESAATVKSTGATLAITSTGSKSITATGLTASTTYFHHFVHMDAAGNDSVRVSSPGFTTASAGDVTAPILSSATGTKTGSTTASGTVVTDEANGTLYYFASINAVESAATIKGSGATVAVSATGSQAVSFTGLAGGATYYAHYVHRDTAGNDSAAISSASFTTDAAVARLIYLDNMAETGTGPYGYNSAAIGPTPFNAKGGLLQQRLQNGVDGSFSFVNDSYTELMLGITTSTTATVNFAAMPAAVYAKTTVAYAPWTNGTAGTATNAVARMAGDVLRMRRVGSSLIAEVARSATPTNFQIIYTWTGISTGPLSFDINVNSTGAISNLQISGLA